MRRWWTWIEIGLRGLLLRKLRSLLSTLGIVFGVAAVVAMMSIGEGARREAIEQIKLLGTNNIRVKRVALTGEKRAGAERVSPGLTYEDALAIERSLPALLQVAPMKFVNADVRFEGRQAVAQVVGTTPAYENVTNFRVGVGRFVSAVDLADGKKVCVLGAELKQELFGLREALGASIRLGGDWFTVVGLMEPKAIREGRAAAIKLRNVNRDVYIPVATALARFSGAREHSGIEEIAIQVFAAGRLYAVVGLVQRLLEHRHRGADDYELMVPEELLAQAQRTQRIFNIVMGSIAGISLLVGGIGIMNIMLANVSERTREIGIRRAIGATRGDILGQFLTETVLICLTGGVLGILLGFGMGRVVSVYAAWETALAPASIGIAFLTATAVGLAFGLAPARRAARLDPVQALRFE